MSINLGTAGIDAIQELRGNRHFENFVTALGLVTQSKMAAAISSDVDKRTDQTAYVRGMYDLWVALHSAYSGQHISQIKPPAMPVPAPEQVPVTGRNRQERVNAQ